MLILLAIIGTIALSLILVKLNLNYQFNKAVKTLLDQPIPDRSQIFNLRQLDGLPEPVQRYFKHVLKNGQTYINQINLTHTGQFKMGLPLYPMKNSIYSLIIMQ